MSVSPVKIPIADWKRLSSDEAILSLKNRFLEGNPVLSDGTVSAIARPGMRYWATVGDGPIRKLFQQPGAFDDDAFAASGRSLYRLDRQGDALLGVNNTEIFDRLSASAKLPICMAVSGRVGDVYPRLWFTDGEGLYYYTEDIHANVTLTFTGTPADGDTVVINGTYYVWETNQATLDTGSPAGTLANPWKVYTGGDAVAASFALMRAINANGGAGTAYSTATTAHTTVFAGGINSEVANPILTLYAKAEGSLGNGLAISETGSAVTLSASTFTGGAGTGVVQVPTPSSWSPIDVTTINGYVIVIPTQYESISGRFFWIEPGSDEINELNYATAERLPDEITDVDVFNGHIWFMGNSNTEAWYATGDQDTPFAPLQGVVFERGVHEHTAVKVKNAIVTVDTTGGVWAIGIGGGAGERISTPAVEERLRAAINRQRTLTFDD